MKLLRTVQLDSSDTFVFERAATPGEWRGGTARGATRQRIGAGDVVTIPAGTPHQFILSPGEQITYIAFKVAAPPRGTR